MEKNNVIKEFPQGINGLLKIYLKAITYSSLNRFISLNKVKKCTGLSVEEKIKVCLKDLDSKIVYISDSIRIRSK